MIGSILVVTHVAAIVQSNIYVFSKNTKIHTAKHTLHDQKKIITKRRSQDNFSANNHKKKQESKQDTLLN